MTQYNNSISKALSDIFPHIGIDVSKFSVVPSELLVVIFFDTYKAQRIIGKIKRTENNFLKESLKRKDLIPLCTERGLQWTLQPRLSRFPLYIYFS